MSDDENRELERWVRVINGSENAPEVARAPADKGLVEFNVVREWAASMESAFGVSISGFRAGSDPPDFYATWKNRSITIELAQLVDERDLAPKRALKRGQPEPPIGDRLWTAERFVSSVNALLDKKQNLYAKDGRHFEIIVIHHEHRYLTVGQVHEWLKPHSFGNRSCLDNAYLLLPRVPGETEHRPLFCLYGGLAAP